MAFTPLIPNAVNERSTSKLSIRAGVRPKSIVNNFDLAMLRDNFTISTWLLLGAVLQTSLLAFPISKVYTLAPAILLLGFRFVKNLLMTFGILVHPYMKDVIIGKYAAVYPDAQGGFARDREKATPSNGGVCVLLLGAQCNHPLGIFAPQFKEAADYFRTMMIALEDEPEKFGYLGGSTWIGVSERTAGSEILHTMYFKSRTQLQEFAHSESHLRGWNWRNKAIEKGKQNHIALNHEVYDVPDGKWENIYLNYHPSGFAATSHSIVDENGEKRWASPIVDARKGRLRTADGRMGLNEEGNFKDVQDPFIKV